MAITPTSYEETAAKYVTLEAKEIDVRLDMLLSTTLARCSGDIQKYSDRLNVYFDECSSLKADCSEAMKAAIFRRGLPERLRMEAAVFQASDFHKTSPTAHSDLIAALQASQSARPPLEPSFSAEQTAPSPKSSSSATKRQAEEDEDEVDAVVSLATSKKQKPAVTVAAAATILRDGGATTPATPKKKQGSKSTTKLASALVNVEQSAQVPGSEGPSSSGTSKQGYKMDYSKTDFTPGKAATTPLEERASETLQGLIHLYTEREYDREIHTPLEYLTSDDLSSLQSSMCPGYYVNPDGVGNRGVMIEVTSEDTLDVASRWIRSTVMPSGKLRQRDLVLVLNLFDAGEELEMGGDWEGGRQGAQEELWYRTSLRLTCPEEPDESKLKVNGVAYSARVVIVRESLTKGHAWYDLEQPDRLQVVSVASLAHEAKPILTGTKRMQFADIKDREDWKQRWRNLLRLAGQYRHRRLVLGMPGCEHQDQAPVEEIAECFKEVMGEKEFKGGWFEKIAFAAPKSKSNQNRDKVKRSLHGKEFG